MIALMNVGVRRGDSDDWPRRGAAIGAPSCRLEGSLLPPEIVYKIRCWGVGREMCIDSGPAARTRGGGPRLRSGNT